MAYKTKLWPIFKLKKNLDVKQTLLHHFSYKKNQASASLLPPSLHSQKPFDHWLFFQAYTRLSARDAPNTDFAVYPTGRIFSFPENWISGQAGYWSSGWISDFLILIKKIFAFKFKINFFAKKHVYQAEYLVFLHPVSSRIFSLWYWVSGWILDIKKRPDSWPVRYPVHPFFLPTIPVLKFNGTAFWNCSLCRKHKKMETMLPNFNHLVL